MTAQEGDVTGVPYDDAAARLLEDARRAEPEITERVPDEYHQVQELTYVQIGVARARELMDHHLGHGDEAQVEDQIARYRAETSSLAVDIVLAKATTR